MPTTDRFQRARGGGEGQGRQDTLWTKPHSKNSRPLLPSLPRKVRNILKSLQNSYIPSSPSNSLLSPPRPPLPPPSSPLPPRPRFPPPFFGARLPSLSFSAACKVANDDGPATRPDEDEARQVCPCSCCGPVRPLAVTALFLLLPAAAPFFRSSTSLRHAWTSCFTLSSTLSSASTRGCPVNGHMLPCLESHRAIICRSNNCACARGSGKEREVVSHELSVARRNA